MTLNEFLKPEHLTKDIIIKLKKLSGLAEQRGHSLAQMALTWLLKDDMVSSVIVGASSMNNKQNISSIENINLMRKN